jgi:hypothetical protein
MKSLVGSLISCLALGLLVSQAGAEDRISLSEVKRLNRVDMRGHCFDRCIKAEVRYCKRVSGRRAKCVGSVTWEDDSGVNTCRIVNRYEQQGGAPVIYEINKRCRPVRTAG